MGVFSRNFLVAEEVEIFLALKPEIKYTIIPSYKNNNYKVEGSDIDGEDRSQVGSADC